MKLAADEDFNGRIVSGLRRRLEKLDLVRVQDVGRSGQSDPVILEWAAREGRIVLTHDVNTMVDCAKQRIASQQEMPGLIAVGSQLAIGRAIEDLTLLATCSLEGEWDNRIIFLPL